MSAPPTVIAAYPPVTETKGLGDAMCAIPPQQRAFVLAMLDTGGQNNSKAARLAGYGGTEQSTRVAAYRLAHDPKVLAAIREEANKRLHSGAILGASVLLEIAQDPTHKDRFKAAESLLNRGGLMVATEHKITVEHRGDDAAMIAQIKEVASQLGIDPKKLLGSAGVVIDAEFEEVDEWTVGPEDA